MCLHVVYRILATDYSPLHEKKDTSQTLKKNTRRLHGITCRLTSSCKVHFAGKYPYLHVYNIHCHKKKLHFASATQKTCNIVHATHHFFSLNGLYYLHDVYCAMMEGRGGECVHYVFSYRLHNTRHCTKKMKHMSLNTLC